MGFLHYIILFAPFFFFFSSTSVVVESRTPPRSPKTTTLLDVAGSTKKTTTVFSEPGSLEALSFSERDGFSPLSLRLRPRASVRRPEEADYRALTLSRLERDSARVGSLSTRLGLGPEGLFGSESVQAPVISGASQGSGEYFVRVGIGSPASDAYLVIDTGSDVSWVQCAPCSECYQQSDPIFDPASSSSFSRLTCGSAQCGSLDLSECRNGTCLYEVAYGDGSYTEGELVAETLTLGGSAVHGVALGCGHSNQGLFVGAAGLLGLGGGALSLPAQLGAGSFSYCLVDRDSGSASTLEFGAPARSGAVTAELRRNPGMDTFYYVGIEGIGVGGRRLAVPASLFEVDGDGGGGIIVDSGTAVTRLRTDAYEALREAFVNGTRHLEAVEGGVSLFDTCYDLSSAERVEVPTVSFLFGGGKELSLPAENFLIPIDSNGTYCFAFAATTSSLSIIGNVQQQGTRVGFDLLNSVVSFLPGDC